MIDVLMWSSVTAVVILSIIGLVFMLLDKKTEVDTFMYLVLIIVAFCLILLPVFFGSRG